MCTPADFPCFRWGPLTKLAEAGFRPDVPKAPGVYCLWVRQPEDTDMRRLIKHYKKTDVFKAIEALCTASEQLFRSARLAKNYGWKDYNSMIGIDTVLARLDRLTRVQVSGAAVACPTLYLGSANDLRRRLDELAFGGHTANHAVWALLVHGWELDIGWKPAGDYRVEERTLKTQYKSRHGGLLPPLVDR